ncbi:hypothetical protein [Cytophaga aurantiaca]|uniref:hypothetical protein n=1 Tax=Cytophaga aurantiaca TaxID=29530 RepID=UPI000526EC2E|nr:hypothetical protein [Cytophaga aurantiaca]
MKHSLLLLLSLIAFSSIAAKPTTPPLDSTGKDYCYYFDVPFTTPQSWESTLKLTKKFMDSLYAGRYEIIGIDTASKSMKIRIRNKLKSHGMLKNTHKPVYADCYMTFDYIIYYTPTGMRCKVKRLVHYYTFTEESDYMGKTTGSTRTMRTKTTNMEIPMIQTDIQQYTKKVLIEANSDITESINSFKSFKWIDTTPLKKGKKSIEDDDY